METQNTVTLLNGSENENSKFATKKRYVIDSESRGNYSDAIDYCDVYILVRRNIAVTGGDANTRVTSKNCTPFRECTTEINNTFIDKAEH